VTQQAISVGVKAGQQKNPASKTKQDFLKCQRNIFKK